MNICPALSLFSPCIFDFISVSILGISLLFIGFFKIISGLKSSTIGGDEEEREPLISSTSNQSIAYSQDFQKILVFCRSFSILILLTIGLEVVVELYQITHPDLESVTSPYRVAHLATSVLYAFCWILNGALLFFLASKDTRQYLQSTTILQSSIHVHLERWWRISVILEIARLYFWINPTIALTNLSYSKLDLLYTSLLAIRVILIIGLVISSTFYRIKIKQQVEPKTNSWIDTWNKVRKLGPFLWPRPLKLQILVICCFVLLGLGRVVNVIVPYSYKVLVEELSSAEKDTSGQDHPFILMSILAYTFFRFLQGGVGVLSSLQYFLWIPVSQYTTREICVRMLEHLHSLSLQFHISSKTGEVLRGIYLR